MNPYLVRLAAGGAHTRRWAVRGVLEHGDVAGAPHSLRSSSGARLVRQLTSSLARRPVARW